MHKVYLQNLITYLIRYNSHPISVAHDLFIEGQYICEVVVFGKGVRDNWLDLERLLQPFQQGVGFLATSFLRGRRVDLSADEGRSRGSLTIWFCFQWFTH